MVNALIKLKYNLNDITLNKQYQIQLIIDILYVCICEHFLSYCILNINIKTKKQKI